ncbi:MAG: DMT family transporter [Alphaproteobacteria bacterium]|nr:DMT family transporter [Alphaproteobacteria bacterium]
MNEDAARTRRARRLLPIILLFVLGGLWSLGPATAKFVAANGVPPFGMVFWQTFIAANLLLAICAVWKIPIGLDRRHLRYYAFMGFISITLPYSNMFFVMRDLPAGLMSVLIVTAPMITYLVALSVRIERFRALRAAGVAVGLAGVAVLVLPKGSLPSPELIPIALLALATPAMWAASNVFAEIARPEDGNSIPLAMGALYVAAATSLAMALASDTFYPIWDGFAVTDWVIVGYGIVTVATYVLYYVVISLAGAVYLAQVGYIVTITGVGWGALFFGERPSVWLGLAVLLVFAGVALVNYSREAARGPDTRKTPDA